MSIYVLKLVDFKGDVDFEASFLNEEDLLSFVEDRYFVSKESLENFKMIKYMFNVDHSHDLSYSEVDTQEQLENGDTVSVFGFEGDFITLKGGKALVHFGGDALHFCQEWYDIDDVKLVRKYKGGINEK